MITLYGFGAGFGLPEISPFVTKTEVQLMIADVPYAFLAYDQTAWATEPDVHGLEAPTTPEGVVLPAINRWTPFYTRVFRSE